MSITYSYAEKSEGQYSHSSEDVLTFPIDVGEYYTAEHMTVHN